MFVTCYDQERRRRALMQKRGNSKHVSSLSTTCMFLLGGYTHNMPLVMRETCCSTSGVEHVVCIKNSRRQLCHAKLSGLNKHVLTSFTSGGMADVQASGIGGVLGVWGLAKSMLFCLFPSPWGYVVVAQGP